MEEILISFEVANLAKELGFDEPCFGWGSGNGYGSGDGSGDVYSSRNA